MNRVMWANVYADQCHADATWRTCFRTGKRRAGLAKSAQDACSNRWSADLVEPLLTDPGPLSGRRVVVTAGPTRECIDPVRFVSNRSSGKMGFAVAQALREAGAEVTLVSGPVNLATPPGVRRINVESAEQMRAVQRGLPATILSPPPRLPTTGPTKWPAEDQENQRQHVLQLTRTQDILGAVAARSDRPFVVGFAAETNAVEQHAREVAAENLDRAARSRRCKASTAMTALVVLWRGGRSNCPARRRASWRAGWCR
jgi:phosphopantothenoylcysteine decarboxylase/phosphopantothenate--cysteine ligase